MNYLLDILETWSNTKVKVMAGLLCLVFWGLVFVVLRLFGVL
jgi:hypothetical protein